MTYCNSGFNLRNLLKKTAEISIGMTAIAVLILSGCGGGGNSGTAASPASSTTTATIVPFKGKFTSGNVVIKDANGAVIPLQNNTGAIGSDGKATVTFAQGTQYPIIVEVTGTYQNEVTGTTESSTSPIRSVIATETDAKVASGVPATAVTELAVISLENKVGGFSLAHRITANSAVAEVTSAETIFGMNPGEGMKAPQFDSSGKPTDAVTQNLAVIAVLAHNDSASGSLAAKVKALANTLATLNPASAPSDVLTTTKINTAVAQINTGVSTVNTISSTMFVPTTTVQAINTDSTARGKVEVISDSCSADCTTKLTIIPDNGSMWFAQVQVLDASNNSMELGSGSTSNIGIASVSIPASAKGPFLVQVLCDLNCSYFRETEGKRVSNNSLIVIKAVLSDTSSTKIPVNALTNGAVEKAMSKVIPLAPTPFIKHIGGNSVSLQWVPISNAVSYNLYRSTSAGVLVDPLYRVNSYFVNSVIGDSGLTTSTPYYYRVTAVNAVGESLGSAEVSVKTLAIADPVPVANSAAGPSQPDQTAILQALQAAASGLSPASAILVAQLQALQATASGLNPASAIANK